MKWIKFRQNGKFHLINIEISIDLPSDNPNITTHFKRKYFTACGIEVISNPDKVVARDKIYRHGIDEYCDKCLDKRMKNENMKRIKNNAE